MLSYLNTSQDRITDHGGLNRKPQQEVLISCLNSNKFIWLQRCAPHGCWGFDCELAVTSAGPDLFLQTVVLDQADVEGGGPALGPVQHQTHSLTGSC